MSGSTEQTAARDSSRGTPGGSTPRRRRPAPRPRVSGVDPVVVGALVLGLVTIVLLLLATVLPIIEYTLSAPDPAFDTTAAGWDRTGPFLPLLAIATAVLFRQAVRRHEARWAVGIVALGIVLVAVALLGDAPKLDQVVPAGGDFSSQAESGPGFGWFAQSAAAVGLIATGGIVAGRLSGLFGGQAPPPRRRPGDDEIQRRRRDGAGGVERP